MFIYQPSHRAYKKIIQVLGYQPKNYYKNDLGNSSNIIELTEPEYQNILLNWPNYMAKLKIAKNINIDNYSKCWGIF